MTCEEVDDGYQIGSRILSEVWVYVDLAKKLALWWGTRDEVEARFDSVKLKCKRHGILEQFDREIRMLCLPGDVDILEMAYMLKSNTVPRRVCMRLANGNG